MNLKSLHAFVHIMDEGTLVAASNKMHLSQPAVSRLIRLLEEEVGANLFYRDQKSLAPTREAELFYPEARRVVSSINDFPDLFKQFQDNSLVPLRVISQMRSANGLVIPALVAFAKRYPEVKLTLDIHPRRALGRRVQRDKFDVGVYVVPLQVKGIELRQTREAQLQVLLPKGHPLAGRDLLTPKDMAGENYVALHRGLMARDAIDRVLARKDLHLDVFHEVSGTNAAHRLVAGGLGYTFSDPTVLEPTFQKDTVLVPWQPKVTLHQGIYVPSNHAVHEATDAFITCLNEVWDSLVAASPSSQ